MSTNYSTWSDDQIKTDYPLYPYEPNTKLPLIFAGIFAIATIYHVLLATMRGAWGYMWAFCLGCAVEVAGWIFRKKSAEKWHGTDNLGPYAISMLCVVLAPAFLAASLYSTYGRVMRYVAPELSPIKKVALIFVTSDIVSIAVQGLGSGMFSSRDADTAHRGKLLLMGGFFFQLFAFSTFIITSVIFYTRVKKQQISTATWNKALFAVWAACILILVRSVYRTLEFTTGGSHNGNTTGFFLIHEWTLYVFDALLVTLSVAIMSAAHPSFFLPRDKEARLEQLPTAGWKAPM